MANVMANVNEMFYPSSSGNAVFTNCESGASASRAFTVVDTSSVQNIGEPILQPSEEGRGCRSKKKQGEPLYCPVCGVTIRWSEIESHYMSEVNKLNKITSNGKRKSSGSKSPTSPSPGTSSDTNSNNQGEKSWETYQAVKNNRQNRLKVKSRKRKADCDTVCPVCNENINGDTNAINRHVNQCIRKSEGYESSDDESIDVEGDGEFLEYEWAGQTRVRATSMLEGGVAASGIGTSVIRVKNDEEEMDLVVDGDDTDKYGPPQYSERDVLAVSDGICDDKEAQEQRALRMAIIGPDSDPIMKPEDTKEESSTEDLELVTEDGNRSSPVIEALKQKIKDLENRVYNCNEQYRCLICMEKYQTPVVSICCWHVHCEKCWLQTLGSKKLCPQCNMITSPTDLRRIYM